MALKLGRQVAQRLKVTLAYPADMVAGLVSSVLIVVVGVVSIVLLFRHVPRLGAWGKAEVLFCWGFAETAVGLFYTIFHGLFTLNQRYVIGGDLDRVLLRPGDPLGQVLVENISVNELPVAVAGSILLVWAAAGLPPQPLWHWALLPVFLVSAAAVLGGFLTAMASLVFHLPHRGSAIGLAMQLSIFNRYPIDLFAAPLRALLTWVLPLAFAGFYGAVFFLGRDEWMAFAVAQPLVAVFALGLGYVAWQFGLTRYTSTGS